MVQAFDVGGIAATVLGGDMDVGFGSKAGARTVGGGDDKGAVWRSQ